MWPKANFNQSSTFHFLDFEKQMASCESTGRELSFEWSHHRISSIESKVKVTLQNPIKQCGSERVKTKSTLILHSFVLEHPLHKASQKKTVVV